MLLLSAFLFAGVPAETTIVQVDKSKYRVSVKGLEVEVANKAFMTARTRRSHDQMHEAVRIVTKCELVDEVWDGATLSGVLDCDAKAPHPAGTN